MKNISKNIKEYKKPNLLSISLLTLIMMFQFIHVACNTPETPNEKQDVIQSLDSSKKLIPANYENQDESLQTVIRVQNSIRNIAEKTSPAVVNIRTEHEVKYNKRRLDPFSEFFNYHGQPSKPGRQKAQALGSGFVIHKKGYIVTNNHVIKGAKDITVVFSDEKEYKAKLLAQDDRTDLAVLKINPSHDLPVVKFADSEKVKVGDFALAIGNPFGLKGTFTFGIISARGRDDVDVNAGIKNYIQTDASINQGNSGGPLLNIYGEVIGVNTAIYSRSGGSIGIGFAIPSNIVKRVVKNLIDKGFVERGYLGVEISPVPKKIAEHLGINNKEGVFVQNVKKDSPADIGGIKAGDVILKVDGKKISSVSQIIRIISSYGKDKKVTIQIYRNKKTIDLDIKLARFQNAVKAKPVVEQEKTIKGKGEDFLGMKIGSIDKNRSYFKYDKGMSGTVIVHIKPNSAAAQAGLRVGDIIQSINYQKINTLADFKAFRNNHSRKKGSTLIQIKRKGLKGLVNRFFVVENS